MADEKQTRSGLAGVPMAVAVVVVIAWVVFVIVLLLNLGAEEARWTRLTFVFASVQAVAFAGAGAIFGVSVQSERVKKAEASAKKNATAATNGRALAAMTMADDAPRDTAGLEALPAPGQEDEVRRRHAEAARRLFPDMATQPPS